MPCTHLGGRNSIVGVGSTIRGSSPAGGKRLTLLHTCPDWSWGSTQPYVLWLPWLLSRGERSRDMVLIIHFHVAPKLRMSGAIPVYLPLFFHGILRGYIASTVGKCLLNCEERLNTRLYSCVLCTWMFVDPCIIVQFTEKNPTWCNHVSKLYYSIFIWSSACFGRHTAHHQKPKTTPAASGFLYVEGCWTCSWLDVVRHSTDTVPEVLCLTTSSNYTSNNLPHMKNQRPPVQF